MTEASSPDKFRVVIVGGGVAALEAALALADLAPERFETTVLTPSTEFVVRPLTVREPFAYPLANRYAIAPIVEAAAATLVAGELDRVDAGAQQVHTRAGEILPYDALLLALGARSVMRYEHANTIDDRTLDQTLHGMIQDIEGDYIHSVAFVAPADIAWPLPLYELALMTARRAYDMGIDLATTLITPEDRPLATFGMQVSNGIKRLLGDANIEVIASAHVEVPMKRQIVINPGHRQLQVDRIVALPELYGPAVPGIPQDAFGFIPVDEHGHVAGAGPMYAAGDAANHAIKHGGYGAHQADVAASAIAALAGVGVLAPPPDPVLRGMLLTGAKPVYISARLSGGHAFDSEISETPMWDAPGKIVAKYLTPCLDGLEAAVPSPR